MNLPEPFFVTPSARTGLTRRSVGSSSVDMAQMSSRIRLHGCQLVATWIEKAKSPPAGKAEDGLSDYCTSLDYKRVLHLNYSPQ